MRVRTVLHLVTGAALGAGAMYLSDPTHGPARRREARRDVLRAARSGAGGLAIDVRRHAVEVGRAAIAGYRDADRA